MTIEEALVALAPIVGTGGIASILVAVLAYLREMRAGSRPPPRAPELAEPGAAGRLADTVAELTASVSKLQASLDRRQALDDRERQAFIAACEAMAALSQALEVTELELDREPPDAFDSGSSFRNKR